MDSRLVATMLIAVVVAGCAKNPFAVSLRPDVVKALADCVGSLHSLRDSPLLKPFASGRTPLEHCTASASGSHAFSVASLTYDFKRVDPEYLHRLQLDRPIALEKGRGVSSGAIVALCAPQDRDLIFFIVQQYPNSPSLVIALHDPGVDVDAKKGDINIGSKDRKKVNVNARIAIVDSKFASSDSASFGWRPCENT